jgi:hypothetical protein
VLARRIGLRATAEQTPQELAEAAALRLAETPALADIPNRVVALLYRCRWGGEPAGADETEALAAGLDDLDRALAARS